MHLRRLSAWLVAGLLVVFTASTSLADPFFRQVAFGTEITVTQTGGPFVTDVGGGINRWVTPLRWTNVGPTALNDLHFLLLLQTANNGGGLTNMTWDDAAGRFELGASHSTEDNASFFLAITPGNTNVTPIPGYGVDPGDSLPMFEIGDLAPGAFVDTEVNFLLTADINTMFFNGAVVEAVPLPGTLALFALGLAGFGVARRAYDRKD